MPGEGLYRSVDGGKSWLQAKGLDINRVSPFAVLQDRVDPNRIFLGTNIGVFRSLDRGISGTRVEPPKPKPARRTAAKRKAGAKRTVPGKPAAEPLPVVEDPSAPKFVPALTEKVKVLSFTEDEKNGIKAGTDNGLYRT